MISHRTVSPRAMKETLFRIHQRIRVHCHAIELLQIRVEQFDSLGNDLCPHQRRDLKLIHRELDLRRDQAKLLLGCIDEMRFGLEPHCEELIGPARCVGQGRTIPARRDAWEAEAATEQDETEEDDELNYPATLGAEDTQLVAGCLGTEAA